MYKDILHMTVSQLLALQSSHAMFVSKDARIAVVGPTMRILFGDKANKVLGRSLFDLALPSLKQRIEGFIDVELASESPSSSLLPIILNIGTGDVPMQLSSCKQPSGHCQGFIVHLGGIGAVITSRTWQDALKMGKMGIWMYRPDIGNFYQSPSWWQMRGYDAEQQPKFDFKEWLDRLHPDDRDRFEVHERIQWEADGKAPAEIKYRQRNKKGEWIWILARGVVTNWDEDGNPASVTGVDTDITEQVEAERLRAERALEQSHAERMQSIGQLAGGIAHDINNILSIVSGNTELLAAGMPQKNQHLEDILASVNRGSQLTKRLLAFSRKQPLHPTALSPKCILESLQAMLRPTLEANISLLIQCDEDTWDCTADETQLENALLNLALNARDSMPLGGQLKITASNLVLTDPSVYSAKGLKPGEYIVFEVYDTGVGMTQQTTERAFEPYFTTKAPEKGTGLGLSIVFGFAKQSEGHAEIESEQGVGTCIRMYLPGNQDDPIDNEPAPAAHSEVSSLARLRIMVIEDNISLGEIIKSYLKSCGYDVCLFENAEDALAAFVDGENTNLLLTDIMLPGEKNGLVVAKEMLAIKTDMRVLYMSGYSDDMTSGSESVAGTSEYIAKPFGLKELAKKIEFLLTGDAKV